MTTYFVDSQEWRDTFYAEHTNFSIGFGRNGAVVIDVNDIERLAASGRILSSDIIITLVNNEGSHFLDAVSPSHRWLATVDESGLTWGPYERQIERCRKWNMQGVVVTYANEQHLATIKNVGLRSVVMPPCIDVLRPRVPKKKKILSSGRVDGIETPERIRISSTFLREAPDLIQQLPHPGKDKRAVFHTYLGERYLGLLDNFEFASVDCYATRDRMVAKYVEFAASHVLPIGDCPTYMPAEMKAAMVQSRQFSDEALVAEIRRLLASPQELFQRQEAYATCAIQHFQRDNNARRVLTQIHALSHVR